MCDKVYGMPKPVKEDKLPFGQRPSKGSFGKKPSSGSFGKPKMVTLPSGRVKPSRWNPKSPKVKKFHLVLPAYMKYLHRNDERDGTIDVHHWEPRSKIGRNDFFVVAVSPKYHREVIHSGISPQAYIELVGRQEIHQISYDLFDAWLNSSYCEDYERGYFRDMLNALRDSNFKDSVDTVRRFAEEYNYNTKLV